MSRHLYYKRPNLDMDKILTNIGQANLSLVLKISLTKLGQNFDNYFVQYLSNMKKYRTRKNTLDKSWTKIKVLGQIMDKNLTKLSKILIILTNIGH